MIQHVRQAEPYGCVIACVAMICGETYEQTATSFGPPDRGFVHEVWQEYLVKRGFAVQRLCQFDQLTRKKREHWPLEPWADVHLCSVDAGHGIGSHLVVLLRDGTVLDPVTDAPRRLTDYASVAYMAAPYRVGDLGAQGEPVAWAYEYEHRGRWCPSVSPEKPTPRDWIRNIRPLYETPSAPRTGSGVSVEEIARIALRYIALDLKTPASMEAYSRAAAEQILALFAQAPRDGGATQGGWQPIETAPKDGSVFLATCLQAQRPRSSICWADGDTWLTTGKPEKFVDPLPHRWWPTHWHALPAPISSVNTGDAQ